MILSVIADRRRVTRYSDNARLGRSRAQPIYAEWTVLDSRAEAKAIGLIADDLSNDGRPGLAPGIPSRSQAPGGRAPASRFARGEGHTTLTFAACGWGSPSA